MENIKTIKVPTVRRFFGAFQEVGNVIDDLAENCIITPDITESYDILCANVIADFLANKFIALTIADEYHGDPLAYDIHIFDEHETRNSYVDSALKSGKKCKSIMVEELCKIAPFEWQNPFNYHLVNDFAVLHTEID